jgi:osmotically-inducible protein OsmY
VRPRSRERRAGAAASSLARAGAAALALAAAAGAACRDEPEDPTVRQSLREATITAEVRSRLLAVETFRELPLAVVTSGDRVAVTGEVRDSAQVDVVRGIASRVQGVGAVTLDLRVVPPPDSAPAGAEPRRPEPAAPAEPLPSLEEAG